MILEPFGDAAWRLRLDERPDRCALLAALRRLPGVVDAVVTEEHALVTFEPGASPATSSLAGALDEAARAGQGASAPREHQVRVRYDGADLAQVAALARMTPPEVVEAHAAATYRVAAMGFQPGFGYLRGLDPRLHVPRLSTPRPHVPALSLGIAGPYAGIYPFASPGGWSLLGRVVGFAPFDARTGAALALGDRVRFRPEGP